MSISENGRRLPPAANLDVVLNGGRFEPLTALPPDVDNLEIDPLAEEYPMADAHELKGIASSIEKMGILQGYEIALRRHGGKLKILDGRNRRLACKQVSHRFTEKDFKVFVGTDEEATIFVYHVNSARRHLSKEQKEAMVVKLIGEIPKHVFSQTGCDGWRFACHYRQDEETERRRCDAEDAVAGVGERKHRCARAIRASVQDRLGRDAESLTIEGANLPPLFLL